MSEWQDISTAPKDGTAFQARIPGHGQDNIIAWTDALLDENEQDCGGWYFAEEQEPPECWTDGVCWAENEDGIPSVQPTHWKPLPAPAPEDERAAMIEVMDRAFNAWVETSFDSPQMEYLADALLTAGWTRGTC